MLLILILHLRSGRRKINNVSFPFPGWKFIMTTPTAVLQRPHMNCVINIFARYNYVIIN